MLTEEQKHNFLSMKIEIIDINILAHTFGRKINRFVFLFKNTSRHHIFEEFIALRYMENGIILHLVNLDDDNSKFSFRAIFKELNKLKIEQIKLKKLNELLKIYRSKLQKLKNHHRNYRIAHLNYTTDLNFDEFLNFETQIYPLIQEANFIGDYIWGNKINYGFKLGSIEGILNFRELIDSIKIDTSLEKGF